MTSSRLSSFVDLKKNQIKWKFSMKIEELNGTKC
jgi:hypothetical protein